MSNQDAQKVRPDIGGSRIPSKPTNDWAESFGEWATHSYGRPILYLARFYQGFLDGRVAEYGISSAHVPLFAYLWEGHQGVTQNEIARSIGVDKGTVSRNVQTLVRMGYITQTQSPLDSRACIIELTDEGWALAEPITEVLREWSTTVCCDMNAETADLVLTALHGMTRRAQDLLESSRELRG